MTSAGWPCELNEEMNVKIDGFKFCDTLTILPGRWQNTKQFQIPLFTVKTNEQEMPEGHLFKRISQTYALYLKDSPEAQKALKEETPLNLQKSKDVTITTTMEKGEEELTKVINLLFSPNQVKRTKLSAVIEGNKIVSVNKLQIPKETVVLGKGNKLEVYPQSALDLEFAQQLRDKQIPQDDLYPILFKNFGKRIPETFEEIGIGENTEKYEHEEKEIQEYLRKQLWKPQLKSRDRRIFRKILFQNRDAYGISQSLAKMSKLPPIHAEMNDDFQPFLPFKINMGREQEEFLEYKFAALAEAGIIKRATEPVNGTSVFVVPKKPPQYLLDQMKKMTPEELADPEFRKMYLLKSYRMVADMRALNRMTKKTALLMPLLEDQLQYTAGAKFYGGFDILSGFDFLPCDQESQQYFTLVGPRSSWTLLGAPMGWCNTPAMFCDRIINHIAEPAGLFKKKDHGCCVWLDDIILYGSTVEGYLQSLDKLLKQVIVQGVRLNVEKCEFFSDQMEWCGRLLKDGKWRFMDKFYEKILSLPKPEYKHQLAQIIFLVNWLSPAIPGIAEFREVLAEDINLEGKKLKELERRNEKIEWTPEKDIAFQKILELVYNSSKRFLELYQPDKALCLFTDASEGAWSLAVMQADYETITQNVQTLEPKPMMFLSGKFTVGQKKWHISAKELYPIIYAFKRIDFMLRGHPNPVVVYTDHRNLVTVLNPKLVAKPAYLDRLARWALLLQQIDLIVYHVPGEANFLADLLSRWGNEADGEAEEIPVAIVVPLLCHVLMRV